MLLYHLRTRYRHAAKGRRVTEYMVKVIVGLLFLSPVRPLSLLPNFVLDFLVDFNVVPAREDANVGVENICELFHGVNVVFKLFVLAFQLREHKGSVLQLRLGLICHLSFVDVLVRVFPCLSLSYVSWDELLVQLRDCWLTVTGRGCWRLLRQMVAYLLRFLE